MLEAKFQEALKLTGKEIDILVNCAGVQGGAFGYESEELYDNAINTNLKGTYFLSQVVARYMKDMHIKGNILNIASSSSLRPAATSYTISKWGIRGLTLGMAKILAPYGIVVNGLAPGPTATPMLRKNSSEDNLYRAESPIGRFATSEEIANMAVILVSDMSRTIVGDIIYMTGGGGLTTFDDISYKF